MTEKENKAIELSINELKNITGGTTEEFDQLRDAFLSNRELKKKWKDYLKKTGGDEALASAFLLNTVLRVRTAWSPETANIYNDGKYSHEEVLEMIRNYD